MISQEEKKELRSYVEFTNEEFDQIVSAMDESDETIQEFIMRVVKNYQDGNARVKD